MHYTIISENLGKVAEASSWTFEISNEDALPVDDKSCTAVEALQAAKEAEATGLQILQTIVQAL